MVEDWQENKMISRLTELLNNDQRRQSTVDRRVSGVFSLLNLKNNLDNYNYYDEIDEVGQQKVVDIDPRHFSPDHQISRRLGAGHVNNNNNNNDSIGSSKVKIALSSNSRKHRKRDKTFSFQSSNNPVHTTTTPNNQHHQGIEFIANHLHHSPTTTRSTNPATNNTDNNLLSENTMLGVGAGSSHPSSAASTSSSALLILPLVFLHFGAGTASGQQQQSEDDTGRNILNNTNKKSSRSPISSNSNKNNRLVEIQLPIGRIRGRLETMEDGRGGEKEISSFLSVPFAEPPIGSRRFRPPKPNGPWNKTLEALTLSPACYQERDSTFDGEGGFWGADLWNANTPISENCLYLNIWAPKGAKKAAVMVWIFGGGFWYGSPSLTLYKGAQLAAHGNVIVVNINYRVGPFGFLYLNHRSVPGNMGMLDQQLALKWIRKNIAGLGAASIAAHMIAPESRDLFHRGILESGALDNRWAMDSPDKAYRKGMEFAKAVDCKRKDFWKILQCLQDLDAATLSAKIWSINTKYLEFPTVMVSKDKFFFRNKDAFEALRSRDYAPKDLIIGLNSDEGHFWNTYSMNDLFKKEQVSEPILSFSDFSKSINQAFTEIPHAQRQGVYVTYNKGGCNADDPQKNAQMRYTDKVNQMVGDYFFTCDSDWFARELTDLGKSKVYFYYFTQRSSTNPWPDWMGVMHGYEIEYIFGVPIVNGTQGGYKTSELTFSATMMDFWSNFSKTGVPKSTGKPAWPPLTKEKRIWYQLSAQKLGPMTPIKDEECKFWRSVKDMEYKVHTINRSGGGLMGRSWTTNTMAFIISILLPTLNLK